MRKSMIALTLGIALLVGACGADVTASDEYEALELEVADLEQQVSDAEAELAVAQARLNEVGDDTVGDVEVPAEVLALLDEWWAANERNDGSVVELYAPSGYHLYGTTKVERDDLAAHLQRATNPEWITEPYLIVADESQGRYVVTRGMQSGTVASALTFEVITMADGELKLMQTAWTYAH